VEWIVIEGIENSAGESVRDTADYLSFKPGQRLKKARELRGLTVAQVATEMRLALRFITAIEADAYKDLPEPAFVRGYMRRYAQLVKLSPDDIAAKFDECYAGDAETPEPDARSRNPVQILGDIARPRLRMGRLLSWASFGLIAVLLLGFLFWNHSGPRHAVPVATTGIPDATATVTPDSAKGSDSAKGIVPITAVSSSVGIVTATTNTGAVVSPAVSSGMTVLPAPSGPVVLPAPVGLPTTAAPTTAAPAAPTWSLPAPTVAPAVPTAPDTLLITLTAESWVSVRDAKQPLLGALKQGGQTLTLKGQAPFVVNLGNATTASVSINGRTVDLKPYLQGTVASFTVRH
jgi:cytoskeleton protein RodZ